MKKFLKIIPVATILALSFSTNAFAGEDTIVTINNNEFSKEDKLNKEMRGPAAPVTDVSIVSASVNTNTGHLFVTVFVTVRVIGYGDQFCWFDGGLVKDFTTKMLGNYEVYSFNYTYNCGVVRPNSTHTFKFQTTPHNSPWNTETVSTKLNVPSF